jgi:hypothetical protein
VGGGVGGRRSGTIIMLQGGAGTCREPGEGQRPEEVGLTTPDRAGKYVNA